MRKISKSKTAAIRAPAKPDASNAAVPKNGQFDAALVLHQQGKLADAELIYRQILTTQPAHVDALKMLATIAAQTKQSALAIDLFDQVLALRAADTAILNNRGIALVDLNRLTEARSCFEQVLKLKPNDLGAQRNMGNVQSALGEFAEAARHYRNVVVATPDAADAHHNLAVVLQEIGEYGQAMISYQNAIKLAPASLDTRNKLGTMFKDTGHTEEAIDCFRKALKIAPDNDEIYVNLGNALRDAGQLNDAETNYRQAIQLNPNCIEAFNNLGSLLSALGRLDEAVASFRTALAIRPDFVSARSNLLFMYQYLPAAEQTMLATEVRRFGELVAQDIQPYSDWPASKLLVSGDVEFRLSTADPLRVGFVSGDLRQHPVGNFLEGALAALARNASGRIEIFAYANHFQFDDVSERIKSSCHTWRFVHRLTDAKLAEQIRDDGIDVLIDLSGHSGHNRLSAFALKPAPVQATWLGYLGSTGVAAIDYLIADAWTLPLAHAEHFSEKIWHLPECYLCFTQPTNAPEVNALPALANGYVTFGCFNNLTKMNDEVVAVWARILHQVPASRLYLKAKQFIEPSVKESIIERFSRHGINGERLILKDLVPRKDYLAPYNEIDIALDPFPYPGITTTVESLYMGVPVLSLEGSTFLSRQGLGLLKNAGLPQWVAQSVDDYLAKAVAFAKDLNQLAIVRAQLRPRISASILFDASRFAAHFEAALFGMYRATAYRQHQLTNPSTQISPVQRKELLHLANTSRYQELAQQSSTMLAEFPTAGFLWKMLGFALLIQQKPALKELQKAAQLLPEDADCFNNLGIALHNAQRFDEAVKSYQRSLVLRPAHAETLTNIGMSLYELHRNDEAILNYLQAIAINPALAKTHFSLGVSRHAVADYAGAENSYHQALKIQPDFASCHNNLGIVYSDQGRINDALESYRRALQIDPNHATAHNALLFVSHYSTECSAAQLLTEARSYGARVAARVAASKTRRFTTWKCSTTPQRLRIGIVSGDLRQHPVAYFLESVLANIDPSRIELIAYPTHPAHDQITERLKRNLHAWKPLLGLNDETAARLIHADGNHVLFDLSGHTANNRLPVFAWKPAPIQVSWLGFLGTTGLAEIDYVLGDPRATPAADMQNFSEKIWPLPETYCCFTPPEVEIEVGTLPAQHSNFVSFGCFNNFAKMSKQTLVVWARVLHAVPESRLFLKAKQLDNAAVREACIGQFATLGISADRLTLEGVSPRTELLQRYQQIDIALDTFPYTGATTSVEALWMGVPLITLKGDRFIARCGESINHNAGLEDWIATDADDYVAKALAHASDLPRLAELRGNLRRQVLASPLFDAPRFAGHFEAALFRMWALWCEQQSPS